MKAETAGGIPAPAEGKRTPGMTRWLRHCYRTHGVVAALGWLYRQSCRLHSAELQPTAASLAASAHRVRELIYEKQ
jgi:hypothetical protein